MDHTPGTPGPALAITCGLPRSGKTTLGRTLERYDYVRVCPDDIRRAIHGEQFIAQAEPFVWATAETMARTLLIGGQCVLVDATNTTKARREMWVRLAREMFLTLDIFLVETPFDVCIARNNGYVDAAVIERMHRQYERPTHAEGRLLTFIPDTGITIQQCACEGCMLTKSLASIQQTRAYMPRKGE